MASYDLDQSEGKSENSDMFQMLSLCVSKMANTLINAAMQTLIAEGFVTLHLYSRLQYKATVSISF